MGAQGEATTGGHRLDPLLRPRAVAIVGASGSEGSFGDRLLVSLTGWRYRGAVWPVNPKYGCLRSQACFPSLASLPGVPDLAVMAVADARIEAAMAEAAAAGVKAAVLFGRLYEAPGTEPSRLQRVADLAREAGMAICGVNCMGFVNVVEGLKVVGTPPPFDAPPPGAERRGIALLSHSGGTWSAFLASQRDLPLSIAVSIGQELVTGIADYIDYLVEQPETGVIGLVIETLREPERVAAALDRAAARGIPVVAVKLGRSAAAARLALAHSGALSGSAEAYEAFFRRHSVVSCRTLDELADTLQIFALAPPPPTDALAIVTDSGGEQQLMVDLASERGLRFAALSPQTNERLAAVLDPGMAPDNPLDCYGDGTVAFAAALPILAGDPAVGLLATGTNLIGGRPYLRDSTAPIEALATAGAKPCVLFGNIASTMDRPEASRLRRAGVAVLMGTETAIAALAHFLAWHHPRPEAPREPRAALGRAAQAWRDRLAGLAGPLPPEAAFALLQDLGLPVAPWRLAETAAEAAAAAATLGFPLVLKSAAPELLHKSEAGGVVLGIADAGQLEAAYRAMRARHGPRVLLQAQAAKGVELFLGMSRDPTLGPMVTLGLGGLFVEALADAQTLLPAAGPAEIDAALERLRGRRLLQGFRGLPAVARPALLELVERFAAAVALLGDRLAEVDINPLIATPQGLVAVDALVVIRPEEASA